MTDYSDTPGYTVHADHPKSFKKKTKPASGARGVEWADITKDLKPKRTCANARVAVEALGVRCRYDEFHDVLLIEGNDKGCLSKGNVDHACHLLRIDMHTEFGFDPGKDNIHDAVIQLGLMHRFDPVQQYLDGLEWDGTPRIERWLSTYLSADDSPLNREIGMLMLVAAVRRARSPGCKFDHIPVLEGDEGTLKSSTIELLAGGPENFSDQTILGLSDRQQQEQLRGKWLYEISELGGMKRAEVEHVKAFASRTHDRSRPAYGRSIVDQPRRGIMIATTNNPTYLKSQTGDRRFWPVYTRVIDFEALRRDRDQLWAEAAHFERTRMSLVLRRELWADAAAEQDQRLELDPWLDLLSDLEGEVVTGEDGLPVERIATQAILLGTLKLAAGRATSGDTARLKNVMNRLGWHGPDRMRFNSKQARGYWRSVPVPAE